MPAPDGVITVGHRDYLRHRPDYGGQVRWTEIAAQCTPRLRALQHIRQYAWQLYQERTDAEAIVSTFS
jgi:hypothetical protein